MSVDEINDILSLVSLGLAVLIVAAFAICAIVAARTAKKKTGLLFATGSVRIALETPLVPFGIGVIIKCVSIYPDDRLSLSVAGIAMAAFGAQQIVTRFVELFEPA